MRRALLASWLVVLVTIATSACAGEVSGRVTMPDVCAPAVSPAVVTLEPVVGGAPGGSGAAAGPAGGALVGPRGPQFWPGGPAVAPGETGRVTQPEARA